jgi:hypothetical protein
MRRIQLAALAFALLMGVHASSSPALGVVTQQWVARYDGPASSADQASALAVDGSGNVYVTGGSIGSATGEDYATVKYNAGGVQQWAKRYDGPASSADEAYALAVDGSGNVYVTGGSIGSATDEDYATVKYNAAGVQQWAKRYDGPASSADEAYALAVDGSGNVYVTGYSDGSGTAADYATIKYTQPLPVGGIAELPAIAGSSAEQPRAPAEGFGWSAGGYAALSAGLVAAVLVTAAGAWYARRRWVK